MHQNQRLNQLQAPYFGALPSAERPPSDAALGLKLAQETALQSTDD